MTSNELLPEEKAIAAERSLALRSEIEKLMEHFDFDTWQKSAAKWSNRKNKRKIKIVSITGDNICNLCKKPIRGGGEVHVKCMPKYRDAKAYCWYCGKAAMGLHKGCLKHILETRSAAYMYSHGIPPASVGIKKSYSLGGKLRCKATVVAEGKYTQCKNYTVSRGLCRHHKNRVIL